MASTLEILDRLIAFRTVSSESNLAMIGWIESFLRAEGYICQRLPDLSGQKAGLVARIGPAAAGGIVLSAHTDVVPVIGQDWSQDPFRLTAKGDRLYGRGTTDMKGFLASMLAMAQHANRRNLARPLILVLSYDEELGCLGIRDMMPGLLPFLDQPAFCIVGEPTSMRVATGHKGKVSYEVTCHGETGHSALAPRFCNALHLAADLVAIIRKEQRALEEKGAQDSAYDIPYSTLHVGSVSGGGALNIVPDRAVVTFECRHLAEERPASIRARIQAAADMAIARMSHPAARMDFIETNAYPGLETPETAPVVESVAALLGNVSLCKVAFGTEAGFFAAADVPTVVCGPGSMAQGHQPDEFIDRGQLQECDAFLGRLLASLQ